jgi:ribosomal protein S18 acetylase RimI-like enzyme
MESIPQYKDILLSEIDCITELWIENSDFHKNSSTYFSSTPKIRGFSNRVGDWQKLDKLKNSIASISDNIIGYCISSVRDDRAIIESLFINEKYRKRQIGSHLL